MKTLYSNPDYVRKMAMLRAKQLAMFPPAIPFDKPKKKKDEEEDDKDKYKSFDIKLNAEDDDSKVTRKVVVYSNGTPEEYCCWYKNYLDLIKELNIEEPQQEVSVLRTLLTDEALHYLRTNCPNIYQMIRMTSPRKYLMPVLRKWRCAHLAMTRTHTDVKYTT